jgi:hypothetical protein
MRCWFSRSFKSFSLPYTSITFLFASLKLLTNFENAYSIVFGNLKSENSQDYVRKPQRNFTFMNSAYVQARPLYQTEYYLRCSTSYFKSMEICQDRGVTILPQLAVSNPESGVPNSMGIRTKTINTGKRSMLQAHKTFPVKP